jgi:23S rRNA (cytidine1920-2'-O)/16S rRNA (cytidine1409-2'-O)-methyltransferase
MLLTERGLAETRSKAQGMIMAGEVMVDGQKIDKPGSKVLLDAKIDLKTKKRFVGRGGEKLEGALRAFPVITQAMRCADIGACTGGFTDCLLQHGATKVYAIDVGYGQLDYRLRSDPRVVTMERTNARYVDSLPEPIDLVVADVSFISLKLIIPKAQAWLTSTGQMVVLIKPQFEAGKDEVGKGGIIRDKEVHRAVLLAICQFIEQTELVVSGLTRSPIQGSDGNIEFLAWLTQNQALAINYELQIHQLLDEQTSTRPE